MYSLKGFMIIDELASNVKGVVANHGEISTYAETFARDIGKYSSETNRGLQLLSFSSKNNAVDTVVSTEVSEHVITIFNWLLTESKAGTVTSNQSELLQALNTQFDGKITNVSAGTMGLTGTYWFPEWLSWTFVGTENFELRVWLSDSAFRSQYDEYEITVIPPVASVDLLINTLENVTASLAARGVTDLLGIVRTETATEPCTMILSENYAWSNPIDTATTINTTWTLVIRGNAGNNPDAIKNAIKTYILANTIHDSTVWSDYIADIFKSTEYILVPLWDQYAVANLELAKGVYSPMVRYGTLITKVTPAFYGYSNSHLVSNLTIFDTTFNSLAVVACGSIQNRNSIFALNEKFSDYICVPSTDADFDRMSTDTQNWVVKMLALLEVAESMTQFSDVPVGFSRTIRNNIVYACATINNVLYLAITKSSYTAL